MKNINNLIYEEREIVNKFVNMTYPDIYKIDKTDRILFVELVDFDVCPYLLGKGKINHDQYTHIMNEYERYLTQTNPLLFDKYAKEHYDIILKLMDLFKKYYAMQ